MDKIINLGQVYTPKEIVKMMFELSLNSGTILEPSSGDDAFVNYITKISSRDITSIEIDPDNKSNNNIIMDFFDLGCDMKYDTIIGNPPYVSFKNITKNTLSKIHSIDFLNGYDNRTNLYIYFIHKCIEHLNDNGEIIFITPREFIKSTSSIILNNFIYKNGTITDWYEFGDNIVFKGFNPTVVVWRFQKNQFNRKCKTNEGVKNFLLSDGQIVFTNSTHKIKFNDIFNVKVGAVSGLDKIFADSDGNKEFVCSYTKSSGKLKKMFYNMKHDKLFNNKSLLLNRKIKKFDENNWWLWGRGYYDTEDDRIYVNCKTRDMKPFFTNPCKSYDGSVLAIFPKLPLDMEIAVTLLNDVDWNDLGFKVGGRLCFTQKSLENSYLPDTFSVFLKT
jgi:adenine-specific DNA-methyltransferase